MKIKLVTYVILSIYVCQSMAQTSQLDHRFLQTEGTVLKNQLGDTITLRGTNLGSWLSMEYWMCPLNKGALLRENWSMKTSSAKQDITQLRDGDNKTAYNFSKDDATLILDFGTNEVFNSMALYLPQESIKKDSLNFKVEVSQDGQTWEKVKEFNMHHRVGLQYINLPNVYNHTYLKLHFKNLKEQSLSVSEVHVFMEDDYSVRRFLEHRFGEKKATNLLDEYQKTWIDTQDLDRIKNMGMNMVRVPFYWLEVMNKQGDIRDSAFDQLDWVIQECKKRDVYVILDLHGGPGGINGFITSGQATINNIWDTPKYRQWTIKIWQVLAHRYREESTVAMYDLLNEPFSSDKEQYPIHQLYNEIYQEVRKIDSNHIISIGAFPVFSFMVDPKTYEWEQVIYQVHHYNTDKQNHESQANYVQAILEEIDSYQEQWKVPVLAGEFNFWNFPDVWETYLKGLNSRNVSWCNWAYKNSRVDEPIENWGFYQSNTHSEPDLFVDTYDTIKAKWSKFNTSEFQPNNTLIPLVTKYASE